MFTLQGRSHLIWGKLRCRQVMWFTGLQRSKKTHVYQTWVCLHSSLQCHSVSIILRAVALHAADVAFWAASLTVQSPVKPGKKGCALFFKFSWVRHFIYSSLPLPRIKVRKNWSKIQTKIKAVTVPQHICLWSKKEQTAPKHLQIWQVALLPICTSRWDMSLHDKHQK